MSGEALSQIVAGLKEALIGEPPLGARFKLDLIDAGMIMLDGTGDGNTVNVEDGPADCSVSLSLDDFKKLAKGTLNPTTAFMQGRVKLDGDLGAIMKLQPILQKTQS